MKEFIGYSLENSPNSLENKNNIDEVTKHVRSLKFDNIRTFDDVNYLKSLNVGKYKITVEHIEDVSIDTVINIVEKVKNAQREFFNLDTSGGWGKIDGRYYYTYLSYASMTAFLSLDNIDEFKYFCLVALIPDNNYKSTNITSKLIEIGKCTNVSVSKSKTDKDAFVAFNSTKSGNNGILFFKEKEHYAGIKLGIDPAIQLSGIYSL